MAQNSLEIGHLAEQLKVEIEETGLLGTRQDRKQLHEKVHRRKRYDIRVLLQVDQWSSTKNIESIDFIDITLAFGINTFVSFGLEI